MNNEEKIWVEKCLNDFKLKLALRRYSNNTCHIYLSLFEKFANKFCLQIDLLKESEICQYVLEQCNGKSYSFQNTLINAIKFYYEKVRYRKRKYYKIDRPKQERKLPHVIDHDEVLQSIAKIENIKHKAIISLAYSTGIRVSEVVNIKIEDVDSKRMMIQIKNAKGNKDRVVPLSKNILILLIEYYKVQTKENHKPSVYLFENPYKKGVKYSAGSCQAVWKKFKINKQSTFHTLRHSCFTYLLENGTDIRIIKDLAGHENIKTTEGYTHVSKKLLSKVQLPV